MRNNQGLTHVNWLMRAALLFLTAYVGLFGVVQAQDIAITNATVYTSPGAAAKLHTTVLIQGGKIVAVGNGVSVPPRVQNLPCRGCVIFAGFWNTHVHFTGPQWDEASKIPPNTLTQQMQAMLTHSGFATVVDTSSDRENTVELRHRIESGDARGPRINTAGFGLYPPHGIPYYLDDLPASLRAKLPQPDTPAAAISAVQQNVAMGTDIVKFFVGSYHSPDDIIHMPVDIAKAAVAEGHRHGELVFAHPSDLEGLRIAMESGVDVLAHAPSKVDGVDDALLKTMADHHMAMIPTLKLFSGSNHIERIREIVARFHVLGGILLFGTDTGFLTDYDVKEEYLQLGLAGLSFHDVLAMLTTAPAAKFKVSAHSGTIRPGNDGGLTVLLADPAAGDLQDFSRVAYTIRAGRVIFDAPAH
jgi:imidazolonepropionase-like amidohydrolase